MKFRKKPVVTSRLFNSHEREVYSDRQRSWPELGRDKRFCRRSLWKGKDVFGIQGC